LSRNRPFDKRLWRHTLQESPDHLFSALVIERLFHDACFDVLEHFPITCLQFFGLDSVEEFGNLEYQVHLSKNELDTRNLPFEYTGAAEPLYHTEQGLYWHQLRRIRCVVDQVDLVLEKEPCDTRMSLDSCVVQHDSPVSDRILVSEVVWIALPVLEVPHSDVEVFHDCLPEAQNFDVSDSTSDPLIRNHSVLRHGKLQSDVDNLRFLDSWVRVLSDNLPSFLLCV